MTGIYSNLPPDWLMTCRPMNAIRALRGERPLCWNRPDFPPPMSPDCRAWAVHPDENPAAESVPGMEGWRCHGCRHLPTDPRVIERAKQAEAS